MTKKLGISNLSLSTTPAPLDKTTSVVRGITPTLTLTAPIAKNLLITSLKFKDLDVAKQLINSNIRKNADSSTTALPKEEPPKITIEGLSVASGASPVQQDVSTVGEAVSIVQDSTDSEIKRAIVKKTMGPQPVILSFTKVPAHTTKDIDTVLEVSQFERQIIKETVELGLESVKSQQLKELGKSIDEELLKQLKLTDSRISALSYMREVMDTAASGLNVSKMSPQIMQKASDSLAQILVPTEASNPALPGTLDEYISLTFPYDNIDRYLTNTSRLAIIAQDMMQSCISVHPVVLSKNGRVGVDEGSALFSVPGAYTYDPNATNVKGSPVVPIVTTLFGRNESNSTIKRQFVAKTGARTGAGKRANSGFITTSTTSTAGSGDEMWDDVLHSICALSNEMMLSAGIGRLQGSRLGNRFLEKSAANPLQYDPFIRLLGFSPVASAETVSKFFSTGPQRAGSFFDYLALGEEAAGASEVFVVMPFEVNTVNYGSDGLFVSGRQYFIDLPVQLGGPTLPTAIQRFSNDYAGITRDMSAYMTELMALDVSSPLSPDALMARILQDFESALSSLADEDITGGDRKSAFVMSLFALAGFSDGTRVSTGTGAAVLSSDVLKMSIVKALRDLGALLDDKSYFMSRDSTEYSVSTPGENPEPTLGTSLKNLSEIGNSNDIDPTGTYRRVPYIPDAGSATDFLHDKNFQTKSNLINSVARTIREIQRETLNLAQRGGTSSDYRNASGGTNMSNCDEDRLIDVIATIYMNIAYLLLPVTLLRNKVVLYDYDGVRLSLALLTEVIDSLINGAVLSADDIRERIGLDEGTPISLSPFGDNTEVSTPAAIVSATSRIVGHRYYIKSSLKILEAVAAGVSASSSKIGGLFGIIFGNPDRKKLKDVDADLYDMFVAEADRFEDLRKNLSDFQINLMVQSRFSYGEPGPARVRSDIHTATPERLAVRDFMKSVYTNTDLSDLHVASVGIPSGLLDSLYTPALEIGEQKESEIASRGTENDSRKKYIRIEVDRFDNIYCSSVASVVTNVMKPPPSVVPIPPETEFDPEIFILPGSIQYDPASWPAGSLTSIDAIFRSTTFSRVRMGKIVEAIAGSDVPALETGRYMNTLRSYLLDLFLYDTLGVRYYDGVSPPGPPQLSKAGYEFIKAASSNDSASKALASVPGFVNIFDPITRRIKQSDSLRLLLAPKTSFSEPEFTRQDIRFAAALACTAPLCDASDVVRFRPYERIYHFFYDESLVRNQIPGDRGIDLKSKRRRFDIYTLSARTTYGGGLGGN